MKTLDDLVSVALKARQNAYAPYSGFAVGAAVQAEDGSQFGGCNVENAAYPEGVCAEASAISALVGAGHKSLIAVAVVGGDGSGLCTPCGGCLQKIKEFAKTDTIVVIADGSGHIQRQFLLSDLLPVPFGPLVD